MMYGAVFACEVCKVLVWAYLVMAYEIGEIKPVPVFTFGKTFWGGG